MPALKMNEWTELELGRTRTRLEMPTDQVYPTYWLTVESQGPVRVELVDAPDGSDPDLEVTPRLVAEVQVRRGECAVSADRRARVRVRVSTRQSRA